MVLPLPRLRRWARLTMADSPPRRRHPRFSVPGRFGLPDGAPWTGTPIAFFRFAKAAELPAGHVLVLQALLCLWRPEAGNVIRAPVRQLVDLLPLGKSQVSDALNLLAGRGIIGYLPVPRQPSDVDLTPLLAHVRETHRTGRLARPETQQLGLALVSGTPDSNSPPSVSGTPDSPVRSEGVSCPVVEPGSGLPRVREDSRGGVSVSGEASDTPRDQGNPHDPENGTGTANGHAPDTAARRAIDAAFAILDPRRPRATTMTPEERAAHAERVREQAAGFEETRDAAS